MSRIPIIIEPITTTERFHECEEVQKAVWGMQERDIVPLHLLVTAQKNGGLVLGAFDKRGRMVGFVFGFLGAREPDEEGEPLSKRLKHCSHMMGVLAEYRGQGIGYQLKLAQREWVLRQGLELITWTYDPLESMNAALNIGKLGCICRRYLREVYGEMREALNVGLPSDRFLAEWWLTSQRVVERLERGWRRRSLEEVLQAGGQVLNPAVVREDGLVEPLEAACSPQSPLVLVEIPGHIQGIKAVDMALARRWRLHTRQVFEECFAAGYTVTDFVSEVREGRRRSYYVLRRE